MYLTALDTNTLTICNYDRTWLGAPTKAEHESPLITASIWAAMATATTHPPRPADNSPKAAMWAHIRDDYTPSLHPSYITCAPLDGNTLAPAVQAAAHFSNWTICSTLIHLAVEHCFDATYSLCFHKGADNNVTCPCSRAPAPPTLLLTLGVPC